MARAGPACGRKTRRRALSRLSRPALSTAMLGGVAIAWVGLAALLAPAAAGQGAAVGVAQSGRTGAGSPASWPVDAARIDPALFDPDSGLRRTAYRAPVPGPPPGVEQVALDEALRLHQAGAAWFIDVMPVEDGVRDPATGAWRLRQPRQTIPGAFWFPEVGRAQPPADLLEAFIARMRGLAAARLERPLILFCLADCWMSWNAALRLKRLGIGPVLWLAEGTDGWVEAGQPLKPAWPEAAPVVPRGR